MRPAGGWGAYSYSIVGIAWAGAVLVALGFGLASAIHHLGWILEMPGHRLATSAIRVWHQQRRLQAMVFPHLTPFWDPVPPPLGRVARWYAVDDRQARYAFTWGIGRRRVAVSRGLWEALNESERLAVMHHEAAHAANHDPLQQVLLQILSQAFSPLGMGALYQRYLVQREIRADQRAVAACQGDDTPLLAALKAAVGSNVALVSPVGLAGALEARIQFLETHHPLSWSNSTLRLRMYASMMAILLTLGEGWLVWCHW